MNSIRSKMILLLLGALIGVLATLSFSYLQKSYFYPRSVSCTLEANICPDGSSVGRVSPNCEFAPCPASNPTPIQEDMTYCIQDKDCILVNQDMVPDCCYVNGCEPIDYSFDKWIAVSSKWNDEQREKNCPKNIGCPNCAPKPIDETFKAVCQNNTCQKVPYNSQVQSCGGWNTSGEIICECTGNITKSVCPTEAICDDGTYYCEGICGKCCYKGIAENVPYPKCL